MGLRHVLAIGLGLMGLVFFAQGTGLFTMIRSVMNNQPIWAVIGTIMVIGALLIWPRSP
jgi:hypothetical protein